MAAVGREAAAEAAHDKLEAAHAAQVRLHCATYVRPIRSAAPADPLLSFPSSPNPAGQLSKVVVNMYAVFQLPYTVVGVVIDCCRCTCMPVLLRRLAHLPALHRC